MNGFSNNFCNVNTNGFPSPCGVWVVSCDAGAVLVDGQFPSPCGVWVVSTQICDRLNAVKVSVPLRGVGCFRQGAASATGYQGFPSPCGVWVVSLAKVNTYGLTIKFPSPCGVWVVSSEIELILIALGFRPLAGCGSFPERK